MVDIQVFRNGMSLLTGAVNVITTSGDTGRFGFTASAVCSVTDSPPTLLVCMNRSSNSHRHFLNNKILSVNVLAAGDQHISQAFSARISMEERFQNGIWQSLVTGAPVLKNALVSFDCRVMQSSEVGTHTIFYCEVVAIQTDDSVAQNGLIYFNRAYHQVGQVSR